MKNTRWLFVFFCSICPFLQFTVWAEMDFSSQYHAKGKKTPLDLLVMSLGVLDLTQGSLRIEGSRFVLSGTLDPSNIDTCLFAQGLAQVSVLKGMNSSEKLTSQKASFEVLEGPDILSNVKLAGRTVSLDSSVRFIDDFKIIGDGTVCANNNSIRFDGSDLMFQGDITWTGSPIIDFGGRTYLADKWAFDSTSIVRGHGRVFDLSMGGALIVKANTTLILENIKIKGLSQRSIVFEDCTSKLCLKNVVMGFEDDYVFSLGTVLVSGPTIFLSGQKKVAFEGASELVLDGYGLCLCKHGVGVDEQALIVVDVGLASKLGGFSVCECSDLALNLRSGVGSALSKGIKSSLLVAEEESVFRALCLSDASIGFSQQSLLASGDAITLYPSFSNVAVELQNESPGIKKQSMEESAIIGIYGETFYDRDSSVLSDGSAIVTRNICFDVQKSIERPVFSNGVFSNVKPFCTRELDLAKFIRSWNKDVRIEDFLREGSLDYSIIVNENLATARFSIRSHGVDLRVCDSQIMFDESSSPLGLAPCRLECNDRAQPSGDVLREVSLLDPQIGGKKLLLDSKKNIDLCAFAKLNQILRFPEVEKESILAHSSLNILPVGLHYLRYSLSLA